MPRFCRLLPIAVKPPKVGVELSTKFRQLCEIELNESFPSFGLFFYLVARSVFRPVGIVRMRPVEQREVQSQPQSLSAHLLRKRREQVATRRRILPGAQFSRLGVPQRHAVVVLGRNDGVLRTALLNQAHPLLRVPFRCREPFLLRHILVVWQPLVVKRPTLRNPSDGIDSPMDEDAELGFPEPFHPLPVVHTVAHGNLLCMRRYRKEQQYKKKCFSHVIS